MKGKLILYAVVAMGLLSHPATAQNNCGQRDMVLDRLASKYRESRQSVGLGANNTMIEVFASDETGTWTITATNARGITCLLASGQAFETLTEALPAIGNEL
ncbi:hypothetical protein ROA7450_01233 [Roseovarius albus]|uniref:Uncharacterized protein n=1 Tax=Roseovarius albus TaxID=1247867 RepID=A0A1X6YS41_9RHOB|nr:hypothetical protein [Roseovarius albus]SLN29117.1 hypothetical protein ROA7450_01233 [Roseovarius albus]